MDRALLFLLLAIVAVALLDVLRSWLDRRDAQRALDEEMGRKAAAARDLLR